MRCSTCSTPLPHGARFCSQCAAPVDGVQEAALPIPQKAREAADGLVGRGWVLDAVAEWLAHGAERFFLLTGEPGSGKTALVAWLAGAGAVPEDHATAARLEALRGACDAVHFCMARQYGGTVAARGFVESLAGQLAARHPRFAEAAIHGVAPGFKIDVQVEHNLGEVIGVKTKNLFLTGAPVSDAYETAVRQPLRTLADERPDLQVLVLVDALDDALSGERPSIVRLLAASDDLPEGVRFLLTTRHEPRVLDEFDNAYAVDLSGHEAAKQATEDVRAYVAARLADHAIAGRLADGDPPELIAEQLAEAAGGNFLYVKFLLDEVAKGDRPATDLSTPPQGLFGLYRRYLRRIVPDDPAHGPSIWLDQYRPLLGSLSVAHPAAPLQTLPRWLTWDEGTVHTRIEAVSQLTQYEPVHGDPGFRVFHRSMAEFLTTADYVDGTPPRPRPNIFYVAPKAQHDRIVRSYLDSLARDWGGDWTRCDLYGLSELGRHMHARFRLSDSLEEQGRFAEDLYRLVNDDGFQNEQRRRLGGVEAVAGDTRIAVSVALERADFDQVARLAERSAQAAEVELRGLAVRVLTELHAAAPAAALAAIRRLLKGVVTEAWNAGLRAAHLIGPPARQVFDWATVEGSYGLRRAACHFLYLHWSPMPDNLASTWLRELAAQVRWRTPRRTYTILTSLADVSIAIYINHPERAEVARETSDLWHDILVDRLHLQLMTRPALDKFLSRVVARVFSRRVLETALFTDGEDPERFFGAPAADKERFAHTISLVSPETHPRGHEDELAGLLDSDVALLNILGALVLAIHAHRDSAGTEPLVRRLFNRLGGHGRRWVLLAFTVLLPDTPGSWTALLEDLTARLVDENRELVEGPAVRARARFNFPLLPLGLAYGKSGQPPRYLEHLLDRRIASQDPALARWCVEGLGQIGFYYPETAFKALQGGTADLSQPDLEDALVTALATMQILHLDAVDTFLAETGMSRLHDRVSARADIDLVQRQIWWIGMYNNAVHQALHYPVMRRELLIGGLQALARARNTREFLTEYTAATVRMLREAEYELLRWTRPD